LNAGHLKTVNSYPSEGVLFVKEHRVFTGGHIYTLEAEGGQAEALLVRGDEICAVGREDEIRAAAADLPHVPEEIDLNGAVVVPGLVDSHTHFASYCEMSLGVDLTGTETLDEALERVRMLAAEKGVGEWIRGWGWNKNLWDDDSFPLRSDLDRVTREHPVALTSKDGHAMWVNTPALSQAGIDENTPDPAGGRIIPGEDGRPSGVLLETAMDLIQQVISPISLGEMKEALMQGQAEAHSLGLTGVITCEGAEALRALSELNREGKLTLRIRSTLPDAALNAAGTVGLTAGMGDNSLRMFAVKILVDGALGSQTAYLASPYSSRDDGYRGVPIYTEDELSDTVQQCRDLGFPVAVHAIGDAANHMVLNVLERHPPPDGLRDRIEHAQLLKPDDISRFSELGIVASVQPAHLVADRDLVDRHWGERGRYAYAFGSLARAGTTLAFGSDLPVDVMDPLVGLQAAVWRTGDRRGAWYPEQCIPAREAARAYTWGSAYGVGEERLRGLLKPGMLADFSAFDMDPLRAGPEEDCTCCMTVVGGEVVYDGRDVPDCCART